MEKLNELNTLIPTHFSVTFFVVHGVYVCACVCKCFFLSSIVHPLKCHGGINQVLIVVVIAARAGESGASVVISEQSMYSYMCVFVYVPARIRRHARVYYVFKRNVDRYHFRSNFLYKFHKQIFTTFLLAFK